MASAPHPALSAFAAAFADPYADARAFKQNGGKVVGYLTANAPVELVEAAGLFPLRLNGGGRTETPRTDAFMESLFDPTVRAVCEDLLTSRLAFVDALILPRTTDSVQRLYYYLCEQQRTGVAGLPALIFYDLLHTPFYSSAEHNLASLGRVRAALEQLAGRPITDDALKQSIAASNQRRDLLARSLAADLSGLERFYLVAASERMPRADFVAKAAGLPEALAARAPLTGPRVVLAGNAPDTAALHAAIEQCGCVVVGDFHDRNDRGLGAAIDVTLPPMRAISDHYHRDTRSPRTFPARPEALAEFVAQKRAGGVVFFYYAQEEVLTWDYPAERDLLAQRGVESVCLAGQSYDIDASAVQAAVTQLLGAMKRGAHG